MGPDWFEDSDEGNVRFMETTSSRNAMITYNAQKDCFEGDGAPLPESWRTHDVTSDSDGNDNDEDEPAALLARYG